MGYKLGWKTALVLRDYHKSKITGLGGAIRSGKSFTSNLMFLDYVKKLPPKQKILITGSSIETVGRNVLNDLVEMTGVPFEMRKRGSETYFVMNWRKMRGHKFYIRGGGKIRDEKQIQGATFAIWYADEVQLHTEAFINMATSRCSLPYSKIFWTWNPESPYHHLYKNYIKTWRVNNTFKIGKKDFAMFDRMGIPYVKDMKAIQVFNFNFEDNPSLSEAVKDEFRKKYTGVFYKRMILGQWCVAEGRVYSSFTEENNIYDNERMPLYFDSYYIGIDYGSANVTTFLLIAENHDKKITRVIDEYYWDAKHLEECTEWAIDKSQENNYQKSDASFFEDFERFIDGYDIDGIYIDPNAKSFIKVVSDKYNVCEADNDVVNGIRVVSSKFEIGELQIDPKCKHTIEQHTSYSWDSSTDKKQVDKPLKQNDHTCDALRYPIYTRELNGYILKGFANAVNQATGR